METKKGVGYRVEWELSENYFCNTVNFSVDCKTLREAREKIDWHIDRFYYFKNYNNFDLMRLYIYKTYDNENISIVSQQLFFKEQV